MESNHIIPNLKIQLKARFRLPIYLESKKVDLNQVQSGIENVQKTIGLLQDIGFKGRR